MIAIGQPSSEGRVYIEQALMRSSNGETGIRDPVDGENRNLFIWEVVSELAI